MTDPQSDTIVALSTPPGKGAIALIRVSGPAAREIVSLHFQCRWKQGWPARTPLVGHFLNQQRRPLDRVLVTFFPAPGSYTGEDLVEISCHGSPVLARKITETVVDSGARPAEPGEFTLRAFLNGKMDLAQAEAVRDLIDSQTEFQARIAAQQLQGKLSQALSPLKAEIVRLICHMETVVEFVEDEVNPESRERLLQSLGRVDAELSRLERTFELGRIVQEGIRVAIAGKPNAGKSSVFNALLLEERAIVTDIPGTTRDALTETVSLEGIPARLADTAGIRDAGNLVERLGVQKSLEYLKEANVALFVVDRSVPFSQEDRRIWELIRERPVILVLNKEDLPRQVRVPSKIRQGCAAAVTISALQKTHLEDLKQALLKVAAPEQGAEREDVMITNIRHKRCVELARRHLQAGVLAYGSGMSEEFPLYDFRKALDALGQITGETTVEDILNQIFSTFCIGK